ncbi:hypothetical protein K2173_004003 [Erythroxylum novogranatense]|uniref:BHLH domain-containing protein n=1 Tax=Erythroxylum novogranatense TaxID=1862640 RepID=A0AAV8SJH3_9ROSI|nr:hypothetical protein K2173_004003 [Erythroxylum novogranatense]
MMEPPQQRSFGTEGERKPTHDFLSVYTHSTVQLQHDPKPASQSQGGYLKTHDFLRPLERVWKASAAKEESNQIPALEKPLPPTSAEHILPGGIGTYSISHISYFNQRPPKPECMVSTVAEASSTERNGENSNCSSYTGSGFTLWEESASKKGKTGKENVGEKSNSSTLRETASKAPRPSQSSSDNHRNSFSSLASSHLLNRPSGQKNQSFIEMIKSSTQDDDLDDDEEIVLKKESPSPVHKGKLRVKVEGKSSDEKANTPRSKHSATEQRRRSKINDRFQMLRELIPRSDQKRDKASFLMEVIEYVQFLQEKVHKYEGSYALWNHEQAKLVPWENNNRHADSYVDQSQRMVSGSGTGSVAATKLNEKSMAVSACIPGDVSNQAEAAVNFKPLDHHPGITNRAVPFPVSLPQNFCPTRSSITQFPPRLGSEFEILENQHQAQLGHTRTVAADKMKQEDLTIEGGTISVSSVYSRGLLNTLTQALQGSGVDLSQASISVQIELGKQAGDRPTATTPALKENNVPSDNQGTKRSRISTRGESQQALKRMKTTKG